MKYIYPLLLLAVVSIAGCSEAPNTDAKSVKIDRPVNMDLANIGLSENGWYQSYDQALEKSEETGKPILVDFTGSDWCGWCIKLHDEVFSKPEFKKWADENVVLLELDFPRKKEQPAALAEQNQGLSDSFGIRGFPTVLFLNSEGAVLGKYGYDKGGPEVWTKKATKIIASSSP